MRNTGHRMLAADSACVKRVMRGMAWKGHGPGRALHGLPSRTGDPRWWPAAATWGGTGSAVAQGATGNADPQRHGHCVAPMGDQLRWIGNRVGCVAVRLWSLAPKVRRE